MILPLLKLGGQDRFQHYRKVFNDLYFPEKITDILGNRVVFEMSSCWHVCFKPGEEEGYNRAKRDAWSQIRAERIGWIGSALCDPSTEVRPNSNATGRFTYLLIVEPEADATQEYFVVITEQLEPGFVLFVTAFPANHKYTSTGSLVVVQENVFIPKPHRLKQRTGRSFDLPAQRGLKSPPRN